MVSSQWMVIAFSAITVSACASPGENWSSRRGSDAGAAALIARCSQMMSGVREITRQADVRDAEAVPIGGFPYLRATRVLAEIGHQFDGTDASDAFNAWLDQLRTVDKAATTLELRNLPNNYKPALADVRFGFLPQVDTLDEALETCAAHLRDHDTNAAEGRMALVSAIDVPDNYSTVSRVLGFYPLTAIAVSIGWYSWKRKNLAPFEMAPETIPVSEQVVVFSPDPGLPRLSRQQVASLIEENRNRHLGIIELSEQDFLRLAATFAPLWSVDVTGSYDLIGFPAWLHNAGPPIVAVSQPTVFVRLSHTIFEGRVLPQISYQVWFPARPPEGPVDMLAGRLDSVIWRTTIDDDGRPLIHDSIHACGCYHLFFPSAALKQRPDSASENQSEPIAVPMAAPAVNDGQRIVLHLAAGSHYLTGLSVVDGTERLGDGPIYDFVNDRALRSLPLPNGGYRSLFESDGLVMGTERLERFVLWPMGVKSPGAMRQWGNHATAFVGRRHFDDPRLLDREFMQ